MAVLLIYGVDPQPATLIPHSHNGRTWLTLIDNAEERPLPELITQIKSALAAPDTKKETTATW